MSELTELSDNTFERLTQIPRYSRLVPFPVKLEDGSVFEVAMVVLTPSEIITAKRESEKAARLQLKEILDKGGEASSISYREIYNDYLTVNTLWLSMRHPRDLSKFAIPNKEWLLKSPLMSTDKLTVLQERYLDTVLKQPDINDMSKEELTQWINDIIRDGTNPSFLVDSFSLRALKDLVIILVSQITSYKSTTSSAGTQVEDM